MKKGEKMSEESRKKMSEASKARGAKPPSRLGIPNTEEQKAKISATLKAKGHCPIPQYGDNNPSRRPDVRAKISASLTGKPLSEEHKQTLSRNHRRVNPPSFGPKQSASMRARVAAGQYPWRGGTTPEALQIRHSREYIEWRRAVFGRDDFTCQSCNQKGGRLEAHHIKPFAGHPELRLDTNNGLTLCEDCHTKAHASASELL